MVDKLLAKFGYFKNDTLKNRLNRIIYEIKEEIQSRPQYHNIGKLGCLKRIQKLYDDLFH